MLSTEGFTEHGNTTTTLTRPTATKLMDLDDYLKMELPRNRFEFEEMTKNWNTERKRPSPEFLAINRKNKKLKNEYLCMKDGAENVYTPKRHLIESKVTRNMTIMAPRKGFARTPTRMPPICEIDQVPCTIEKRMQITQRKKEIVRMARKQSIKRGDNQDLADTFDEMYDSDDKDLNEREDLNATSKPTMRSYIARLQQGNELDSQKKKHQAFKSVVNMEKESGRNPDDFLKGHPPAACDARFEAINGDIEVCTKFKSSKQAANF